MSVCVCVCVRVCVCVCESVCRAQICSFQMAFVWICGCVWVSGWVGVGVGVRESVC